MSQVALKKPIFEWALHRSGLSAAKLRHKFPKLTDWLSGESNPTIKQLEALAKATHTPFGYFFLETPPEETLPIPHYRTLKDKSPEGSSLDLLETVQHMQQRQAWIRDYFVQQGKTELPFVGMIHGEANAKQVAARIRTSLGLDIGWAAKHSSWTEALDALREAMEEAGIFVFVNGIVGNNTHRKLSVDEFRGFVLVDPLAPLVFVNGADGKAAQMFTLAHELAHVFFGSSAAFDLRDLQPANDPTEKACNEVAAEFLVPADELRQVWVTAKNTVEPFQTLARHFKVSSIVAARRALDIQLIDRDQFFGFYGDYINSEKRNKAKSKGGNFYATQNLRVGRRFGETVTTAVRQGKLLYSEAYRLTGLNGASFKKFAVNQGYWEPSK